MNSAELLVDGFGRVREVVHEAVEGLTPEQLAERLDDDANSIAWLIWHLARVQDDHVSDVAGLEQVWTAQDWHGRFELPFPVRAIGYGHDTKAVAAVRVDSAALLTDYYDAVHEQTTAFVRELSAADLDRVVDEAWTPAVTLGVRLVSVITDDLQHAGQAAFIRGILLRR
ncbi:mycothiol transferase [Embleya scabrispora]|uniref:mycothiol transferase n=1 Tax=Embleya scabrispora TaxID=159449 RepID=UPI000362FD7E|nr:DinB family protein [Embleya scabrispora]MYS87323.1 DUF664 domain-containing protein [Streptomyces sp. SID5474]